MDRGEIEIAVKEILADKFSKDIKIIQITSHLVNDLGMDSFGAIEMVFALEEKFNLKISNEDIVKVHTVQDVVEYIAAKT